MFRMRMAAPQDVENALRRRLTEAEAEWIDPLLDECSDHVAAYLHPYQIPDQTPPEIIRVVAGLAAAVISRPASILPDTKSLSADAYSISFATGSTGLGPYMSQAFKDRLRPFKLLGGGGMVAMGLSSERGDDGVPDTAYR